MARSRRRVPQQIHNANRELYRKRWASIALLFLIVVVYANSLNSPFMFDDRESILDNPSIRTLWPSVVLFPQRDLPVSGRPLVNLSLAINYAWSGFDVFSYHLVNLSIHCLSALLLFGIVRRTLELPSITEALRRRSVTIAFVAALIWAIHPLNTEAVNYVTQRTELLMGLCYLLTIYGSLRAATSETRARWLTVATIAAAAGMASKESMVTAPLMVFWFDSTFLFESIRDAFRERWRFYLGLAATWVLLAALMSSGPRIHSAGLNAGVSPWNYLLNQAPMLTRYVRLAFWPSELVIYYGKPVELALSDVIPQAILILSMLGATLFAIALWPALGFLGAWIFVTLAPTSSIVPIATEVAAERRMYLPLMGIVILIVVAGAFLHDKFAMRSGNGRRTPLIGLASIATVAILVIALSATTIARNREYRSSLLLARTVAERYPSDPARYMLGMELSRAGLSDEAVSELRQVAPHETRAYYPLGVTLFNLGRLDEALDALHQYVLAQPDLLEVLTARDLMAQAYARKRQWNEAADQYRTLIQMRPAEPEYHGRLAECLFNLEKYQEAADEYTPYLEKRPSDINALTNLGVAMAALGKPHDASSAFRRVVTLDPRSGSAQKNLANALVDERLPDEALQHAREAVRLLPNDAGAYEVLGRSLLLNGDPVAARAAFESELQLDPANEYARNGLTSLRK